MTIRKTTKKHLKRVMEIYGYARKFMADHGNPNQWGKRNWPPEELIRSDIEKGCSYVCENNHGDNKVMQGMLNKLGFTHCGTIYVYEDNDPRLAYEKIM